MRHDIDTRKEDEAKLDSIYASFTAGAKFGMIVAGLVLLIKSM